MISTLLRAGTAAAALAAAFAGTVPAHAADPVVAFTITLSSDAAPGVTTATNADSVGAATVTGLVDGVRVDDPSCAVTPGATVGTARVGCTGTAIDVAVNGDGSTTASVRRGGYPGTDYLCVWVFNVFPIGWRLDCSASASLAGGSSS